MCAEVRLLCPLQHLMARTPLSSHTFYFRDAIGNVSSSQLMRTAYSVRSLLFSVRDTGLQTTADPDVYIHAHYQVVARRPFKWHVEFK